MPSGSSTSKPAASASASASAGDGLVSTGAGGDCDGSTVQGSVGQTLNQSLLNQMRTTSGAETARALKPGQMITMEYNPSRLNVLVDNKNVITAARCG